MNVCILRNSLGILALVALVACAGTTAGPSVGSARVTHVSAEPGSGYVIVRWEVAGTAERFEVSRAEIGAGGERIGSFEPIASIEDGSARSFEDERVDPGVSYAYAVAVNGGAPVEDGGSGVRPRIGNRLQVLFGSPVPEGAVVRSEPAGIDCAAAGAEGCTATFAAIRDVTLAVESSDDLTVAWQGCDTSTGDACTVSMAEARTVTVVVGSASRTLDVEVEPPGVATVTNANDLGANPVVDCSDTCTYRYPDGLIIGLRADPVAPEDYRFVAWGGACAAADGPACTVTMDEAKSVRAVFEMVPPAIASFEADPDRIWPRETATLSWSVSGGGEVRVSIEPDVGDVTGTSEIEVSPDETTEYTLTASNDGGTVTATARVSVRSWPFGSVGSWADVP